MGFNESFLSVKELLKDFKENEKAFLKADYSEADVRNDFINKFFIALGWDVRHEQQKNPYEHEVRVEKPVQVAKAQKRADYTFYLAPNFRDVKFFVEAKKPFHDLENKDYFFQTVRYGWNAGTPVAVLTDFEEFIILDCRYRPDINEILNYKIKSFHYTDYANEEKFKEIYFLFARESVADGSIEKYVESLPKPKGKKLKTVKTVSQTIDESFLEELDEIRTVLAKSFKKNNTHLTSEELTEATQRTIDRLVFIKFLEDKMIEPHHYVSAFTSSLSLARRGTEGEVGIKDKGSTAWEKFIRDSITLDAKYNGVVFKKSLIDSKNIIEPDDKTFSKICEELSHENTVYNFDAIPIHILGSIYERFLGKVVNATDKRVTIEEKPEVRKAGGVYYTPQYIVNYIVDNTIGKLIEGKTPKEIAKMRFADIACGSGSFLITVYERLLDYHKRWYVENPEQAKKDGCILYEGVYRLSLQQKQRILTNNIYGVDLDSQAVEVTQLSLYLKLLEDETTATANDTWVMFKEKLLPDLSRNIVNGNSLIGTDILDLTLQLPLLDKERGRGEVDELKLKPMDFDKTFPDVMKQDGFDAIVGNPPYGANYGNEIKHYLSTNYNLMIPIADTYLMFLLNSLKKVKVNGIVSLIVPTTWMYMTQYLDFRKRVIKEYYINEILLFRKSVFQKVTVETCIAKIVNIRDNKNQKYYYKENSYDPIKLGYTELFINQNKLLNDPEVNLILSDSAGKNLFEKISYNKSRLKDIALTVCGLTPYRLGKGKPPQNSNIVENRIFDATHKKDSSYRRYIMGRDFNRYSWQIEQQRWISYGDWLAEPRYKAPFNDQKKIVVRQTADKLIAHLDDEKYLSLKNVHNIRLIKSELSYEYLLGILNSKLLTWWYQKLIPEKGRTFAEVKVVNLEKAPIKVINPESIDEIGIFQKISGAVTQMLSSKKQLQQAKTESDKNYLERKCEQLDKEIDQLVYELYGLTEEEIKIVEGK